MTHGKIRFRSRLLGTLGVATALALVGATGASAWTFATTGAPLKAAYNGVTFGEGAGDVYRSGFNYIYSDVKLRDPVANGNGVFQQTNAWHPTNLDWTGSAAETGRRTVNTWASMNRTTINTVISSIGTWSSSMVCEDASLRPDICSSKKTSAN